jgi:hypothetical protein
MTTSPDPGGSGDFMFTGFLANHDRAHNRKQTEFFVLEVKDKRMTKNGPEFLIG